MHLALSRNLAREIPGRRPPLLCVVVQFFNVNTAMFDSLVLPLLSSFVGFINGYLVDTMSMSLPPRGWGHSSCVEIGRAHV